MQFHLLQSFSVSDSAAAAAAAALHCNYFCKLIIVDKVQSRETDFILSELLIYGIH